MHIGVGGTRDNTTTTTASAMIARVSIVQWRMTGMVVIQMHVMMVVVQKVIGGWKFGIDRRSSTDGPLKVRMAVVVAHQERAHRARQAICALLLIKCISLHFS